MSGDVQATLNRLIEIGDEIVEISAEISQDLSNSVWLEELPAAAEFMDGLAKSIRQMQAERLQLEQEALGLLLSLVG